MKKISTRLLCTLAALAIVFSSLAAPTASTVVPKKENAWALQFKDAPEVKALTPDMVKMGINEFLTLTPSKYKKLTGQKLGLKKSMELKAAQKFLKKKLAAEGEKISKGIYVLLAILGLGWVAIGVLTDWTGNDWWINLLLTFLCWLPGLIHALVNMKKYYGN